MFSFVKPYGAGGTPSPWAQMDRKAELQRQIAFADSLLNMSGYDASRRTALLRAREQLELELSELNPNHTVSEPSIHTIKAVGGGSPKR